MMGFGEEGKIFFQKFFPSSPITNHALLGTEPYNKVFLNDISAKNWKKNIFFQKQLAFSKNRCIVRYLL